MALTKKDRDPVSKVFAALKWLVEDGAADVGVRELASALNVSPSSAHRLLTSLADSGFVVQDEQTARYSLGLEFMRICRIATSRRNTSVVALQHMKRLASQCGETVLLGLYDRDRKQMMFVDSIEAPHPLRYVIELNSWQPVFAGASGQAIMAFLPEKQIQAIIARGLKSITDGTITNPEILLHQLAGIRERGYACTRGQRIKGAVGIGAPIFGTHDEVIGDICVTIPDQRFQEESEAALAEEVIACAAAISAELGSNHHMAERRPRVERPLAVVQK